MTVTAYSIAIVVLLTACSTTPTPVAVAPAPAAAAAAAPDPDFKALEIQGRVLGYKKQVSGGKLIFCRVVTPTGYRIPVTECLAPEALQAQLTQENTDKDKLRTSTIGCVRRGNTCAGN